MMVKRNRRKTKKLVSALEHLGQAFYGEIDPVLVYGLMAADGYRWDGGVWVNGAGEVTLSMLLQGEAQIRVMGIEGDVLLLAEAISRLMQKYNVDYRVSWLKSNDDGSKRIYINVNQEK